MFTYIIWLTTRWMSLFPYNETEIKIEPLTVESMPTYMGVGTTEQKKKCYLLLDGGSNVVCHVKRLKCSTVLQLLTQQPSPCWSPRLSLSCHPFAVSEGCITCLLGGPDIRHEVHGSPFSTGQLCLHVFLGSPEQCGLQAPAQRGANRKARTREQKIGLPCRTQNL